MSARFDLAVVGAGILGLAHAYAGLQRGLSVVVVDREAEAIGASVRNFGFVTVTGQEPGERWRRAMRSREVSAEVAPRVGIPIEQEGLLVVARRPEAMRLLEAFAAGEKDTSRRMRAMRKTVLTHDVAKWARDFLDALGSLPEHHDKSVRRSSAG